MLDIINEKNKTILIAILYQLNFLINFNITCSNGVEHFRLFNCSFTVSLNSVFCFRESVVVLLVLEVSIEFLKMDGIAPFLSPYRSHLPTNFK